MRIWLPDAPGVLGAVAAEIGAVQGNVVGLEVLEREAGVAIDELVVELPDEPGAVDAVCRGVRNVPGAGVEEVTELKAEAKDREDTVLAAAAGICRPPRRRLPLNALDRPPHDAVRPGVAGAGGRRPRRVRRGARRRASVQWVAAFAEGSRSGADPANDTTGSGVFIEPVPETGFTVCGGRPAPIRRRERREIALLVMVASRFMDVLAGRSAEPIRNHGQRQPDGLTIRARTRGTA